MQLNSLPREVVDSSSLGIFKQRLDGHSRRISCSRKGLDDLLDPLQFLDSSDPTLMPKVNSLSHREQEIYLPSFCRNHHERNWHVGCEKSTPYLYLTSVSLQCISGRQAGSGEEDVAAALLPLESIYSSFLFSNRACCATAPWGATMHCLGTTGNFLVTFLVTALVSVFLELSPLLRRQKCRKTLCPVSSWAEAQA